VGPRVIRNVVAGPVWIAPESTPIRHTGQDQDGQRPVAAGGQLRRAGPGFLSAYGLIAGYLVVPGKGGKPDWDNGIRAHGSSEYLSMYSAEGIRTAATACPTTWPSGCTHSSCTTDPCASWATNPQHRAPVLLDNDVFELRVPRAAISMCLSRPCRWTSWKERSRHVEDANPDLRTQARRALSWTAAACPIPPRAERAVSARPLGRGRREGAAP